MVRVNETLSPSDIKPTEDYKTAEKYCKACLIDLNDPSEEKIFSKCKLPVLDPEGRVIKKALPAAAAYLAGARMGVKAPMSEKIKAARKLLILYKQLGMEPPERLVKLAKE